MRVIFCVVGNEAQAVASEIAGTCLISRLIAKVPDSTHLDGNPVNQELSLESSLVAWSHARK
jgi:hypothetical protein